MIIKHSMLCTFDLTIFCTIFQLLVVILVAAVNSGNVSLFVESIMKLSTTDQMTIMSIISPINEGIADKGLQELLQEVLCNAGKLFFSRITFDTDT